MLGRNAGAFRVYKYRINRRAPPNHAPQLTRVYSAPRVHSPSSDIPLHIGVSAGAVAGMISALTGVGGGLVLLPTLARFTTLPQQMINGTSIGAVTISASVGSYNYVKSNSCNVQLAMITTIPAVFSTRFGVHLAHKLSSNRLSFIVGTTMLASTPLIVLKNHASFPKWNVSKNALDIQFADNDLKFLEKSSHNFPEFVVANSKYLVAGAFAGFISGLCGLGGGILMTSYLTATSDMPQCHIIGTSLLSIVPTAISSTYHNAKAQSIHLPTAAKIGASLTLGVYITSKYVTHEIPEDTLRTILAAALSVSAIMMMRRKI